MKRNEPLPAVSEPGVFCGHLRIRARLPRHRSDQSPAQRKDHFPPNARVKSRYFHFTFRVFVRLRCGLVAGGCDGPASAVVRTIFSHWVRRGWRAARRSSGVTLLVSRSRSRVLTSWLEIRNPGSPAFHDSSQNHVAPPPSVGIARQLVRKLFLIGTALLAVDDPGGA